MRITWRHHECVVKVMKMGNIAPGVEIEPTSLAFWASVLTITPFSLCLCSSLFERSVQTAYTHPHGIVSLLLLTFAYTRAMDLTYIHRQCMFENHTTCSLYRIMVMVTRVMDVIKMGNIAHRAGIEPISLAFWASVLTIIPRRLPDVSMLPTPSCLCLRGHCRLLKYYI